MNVFPTYASYVDQFRQLIATLGTTDTLIYCAEDKDLVDLVKEVAPPCKCQPYTTHPYNLIDNMVVIEDGEETKYTINIFGNHNLQNLKAAQLATETLGLNSKEFYNAIQSFSGASKRLQLLYRDKDITAYLDFAHAPSKVKATVNAVREKHPGEYLIACLELHTFSSLNPGFLPQYKDALAESDVKIVYYSPHTLAIKKLPGLSGSQLSTYFNTPDLQIATSGSELEQLVLGAKRNGKTVLLWMSSGRFDGLDLASVSSRMV